MDKQQWKTISRIFDLALTLPANRRTTYIRQLCAGDPNLQHEIDTLLKSMEESEGLLEQHLENNKALLNDFVSHLDADPPYSDASLEGQTIDHWKLIDLLGHGGMGSVYKAERVSSDIRQVGAVKIMHRSLKTPDNVQRFKLEQQILAGLNHPNIANRIDGGVSEDGLPYLVMEYVEGKPIREYCDDHQLTVQQRLKLFSQVCAAVQFAHKNLIVHRDLKPENIMVTDQGYVKILDFGIAKLLDPELYEFLAVETQQNMGLMSLEYAAPEQTSGESVTTSTDLYALGILLFELLAGVYPFDFEDKKYQSVIRIIQEEFPSSPSRKLQHLSDPDLLSEIAASRSIKSSELIKTLKGDLDAIILKALRKEPDARYNSAGQLVDDITSYLQDKPVLARGEAIPYRLGKFFKRHARGLATAAVFLVFLVSMVGYYTFRLAEERNTARFEANKATQVKDLLIDIFQSGDPFSESDAKNLTVQEVLDQGTQEITSGLEQQPLVQAELLEALGNVYTGLVMYSEAEPLLRRALTTYEQELGPKDPSVARASHILGYLLLRKGNYDEAESLFEQSREIYKTRYGEDDPNFAYALKMLGFLYSETGRPQQALDLYRRAVDIYEQNNSPAIAGTLNDLGYLLKDLGKYEEAVTTLNRCITILNEYHEDPKADVANALSGIAQVMHQKGNLSEAEKRYRRVLDMRKEVFPEGHTYIAASQLRLGWVLVERGRIKEAIPSVQEANKSFRNHLPAGHWKIAASEGILALAWLGQGKFRQAEKTLLNTYRVFKEQFGDNDWRTQSTRQTLARLYSAWQKPDKAAVYLAE